MDTGKLGWFEVEVTSQLRERECVCMCVLLIYEVRELTNNANHCRTLTSWRRS